MTTSTSSSTSTRTESVADLVTRLAQEHLSRWQRGYLGDDAKAVGTLARLRRGAGKPAGQLPDLWDLLDTQGLHDARRDGRPLSETELARADDALHTALTLWALHQQSRGTGMHQPHRRERPRGLGAAIHRLMPANDIDDSLRKRLVRAGNAPDLTTLAQRLRDIVTLLRREDVPLDYALLAGQLYQWQWPDGADRVRIAWGRSFHAWQDHRTPGPPQDNPADGLSSDLPDATDKDTP
ncbi:type I-E CRISPR-associated protein Cse2/CasB [Streptomyces omiyaensis]|uniref:type I-E CRISPR-associated protein Cse2/CasB n=1 Tax=Streptomyces omiyaensis TaxID=68247 RepID=UPI001673DF07|nr:type I-E CRISPR-associated protein Cse2/CasB [Streptomyces omiyaensis]